MALIRENLAEILNPEILEKIIAEGRHPKIYWGREPGRRGTEEIVTIANLSSL